MAPAAGQARLVTADELLRMPEVSVRYELVRGVVRERPLHGIRTGALTADLLVDLARHVEGHRLGSVYAPVGFKLASHPDTVRAPSVAFLRRERADAVAHSDDYIPGAPDVAVEAVSVADAPGEMDERVNDYLAAGCRMMLVINAELRTVGVYRPGAEPLDLAEDDAIEGGDVVPGWTLPLRDLFG